MSAYKNTVTFIDGFKLSSNTLILLVTAFLLVSGNATFASHVLKTYPANGENLLFLLSLMIVFGGATLLLLSVLCFRKSTKPVLMTVLLLSSAAAYFMDSYGVIISDDMMRNITHTSTAETLELLNFKLLAYVVVLGVIPAIAVAIVPLKAQHLRRELVARLKLSGITVTLIIATVLAFGSFYASFFREHKELRQHANPIYYLYSAAKFAVQSLHTKTNAPIVTVGGDAAIPASDVDRELVIMVVGETARADRFSLNGYSRETNPQLKKLNVINFTNFWACGTSTAVSVPCMFLRDSHAGAATSKITTDENLLDVLQRSHV